MRHPLAGKGRKVERLNSFVNAEGFEAPAVSAWMRWLPAAYAALVMTLSVLLRSPWGTSRLLIALPTIAAFTLGPVAVSAMTIFAMAMEGTFAAIGSKLSETHHFDTYVATALVGMLAAALAAHRQRQQRSLVRATSVVEALMRTVLRPVPYQIGHVFATGLYRPADVGTMVGGDLYDIVATKAGERAIIGDVRGKGLQAVRTVADILATFREAAYDLGDLLAVADRMERHLIREAEASRDDELFATAVLVEYDPLAHQVTIINYGHVAPVLISRGHVRALTGRSTLPLGLGDLADEHPAAYAHRFTRGDILLLVTDGLVEARDATGAFYPLIDRLRFRFANQPPPGPADVVEFLNTDLPRHHTLHDDIAILAIAPHGYQ